MFTRMGCDFIRLMELPAHEHTFYTLNGMIFYMLIFPISIPAMFYYLANK